MAAEFADRTPTTMPSRRRGVRAVDRALDVLTAFSAAHPRLQLSELAEAAGLPKTSTHRIAVTLVERGFLRQDDDGAYTLGRILLELGSLVSTTTEVARLTAAAADFPLAGGEALLVAEVDWLDKSLMITTKLKAPHSPAALSPVGRRSVLANGCVSLAILSGLPMDEVRSLLPHLRLAQRTAASITDPEEFLREVEAARNRGHATEIEEFLPGIAGVAVPVMSAGRPIGAVAVCGPTAHLPRRRLNALALDLKQLISRALPPHTHKAVSGG
ncbi:IclR family transcriptional regulator [Streptosporangium sp. NPDC000095]|uniref:IclR family transcriptional regulator n=1 Tax=Streptosporangium sp. NPDC000095 TaxID=3366184 RepID=UPI0036CE1643